MPADVAIRPGLTADELCVTEAERSSLAALRDAAGVSGGPIERHGIRMLFICEQMARGMGREVDRELLLISGLLHDIGIYRAAWRGGPYVSDGREVAAELIEPYGWDPLRLELCLDSIEHHHRLRAQWQRGTEVELMRRADLVELSANAIRFGLERRWLRELNRSVPRKGAYGEIARRLFDLARDRPRTLPKIFFAGRG